MRYDNIVNGTFVSRPNRFIAKVVIDGKEELCHVKNTGRCRELLTPGTKLLLQRVDDDRRKTAYDLISVYKGERLINMDSAAPNKVFYEWLKGGGIPGAENIRPEFTRLDSRFDFRFDHDGHSALAEVKGVTLEENGFARFPDAPTERGVKHLRGLISASEEGWETYAVFVIQMRGVKWLEPNRVTHPAFADALAEAAAAGVKLLAFDCSVTENSLDIREPVPVRLT